MSGPVRLPAQPARQQGAVSSQHRAGLLNVGLPRTMPYFFASLKVAVMLAFVGAVISETVAFNVGMAT